MKSYFKKSILLLLLQTVLFFAAIVQLQAQSVDLPVNLSFENGMEYKFPAYWVYNDMQDNDDAAYLVKNDKTDGIYSLKIENPVQGSQPDTSSFGTLFQSIDALHYRGKVIKFSADIKTQFLSPYGAAYLLLFISKSKDELLFASDYLKSPIKVRQWDNYSIEAFVPGDANEIRIGVGFKAGGYMLVDNLKLEVQEPENAVYEESREISEQGLDNLYALAKTFSLVKFFHPSNASESTPWDIFMVNAVKEVENAQSKEELIGTLSKLFKPIAPTIEFSDKKPERSNIEKPYHDFPDTAYYFLHKGAYSPRVTGNFLTTIENAFNPRQMREAAVMQFVDVAAYAGKDIEVSVDIMYKKFNPGAIAQMWLRGDREEKRVAFMLKSNADENYTEEWTEHTIHAALPDDATVLRIGMVFAGDGEAFFDNLKLKVDGKELEVKNGDFESNSNSKAISSWTVPSSVEQAGYFVDVSDEYKSEGKYSLHIVSDPNNYIQIPEPGEIFETELIDGVFVSLPICLWADSVSTYPPTNTNYTFENVPSGFLPTASDRASRLAIAINAWSLIEQFNIREIPTDTLKNTFYRVLTKAASDNSLDDFLVSMNDLASLCDDPLAGVWNSYDENKYVLPLLWNFENSKLIIYKTFADNALTPGDEIIKINNIPIEACIVNAQKQLSKKSGRLAIEKALALLKSGEYQSREVLTVKTQNGEIIDVPLIRNMSALDALKPRPDEFAKLSDKTYYVDLTRVSNQELKEKLPVLQGSENLIFDIRGNSRASIHFLGLLKDGAFPGAQWKLNYYTKPYHKNQNSKTVSGMIDVQGVLAGKNVVFIMDEKSTGYSETILSTVKHNQLGTIIGQASEGSFGEMVQWVLPGFYIMKIPAVKSMSPEGAALGGIGIKPDIVVDENIQDLIEGEDTLINEAINILKKTNN